ncbi:hypothetical protein HA466_0290490 [Hirschfeldia incana]|nr:hypothetical protein HA466_0290490 [Hirschfeldia incana]
MLAFGYDFRSISLIFLAFCREEKGKGLVELFESETNNAVENRHGGSQEKIPKEGVAGLAKNTTVAVLSAADSIIDALEVAYNEKNCVDEYELRVVSFAYLHMCHLP